MMTNRTPQYDRPLQINVKDIRAGDIIKPNGNGFAARVVARVERDGKDVILRFVGGGSRREHHSKRRTVRRPE